MHKNDSGCVGCSPKDAQLLSGEREAIGNRCQPCQMYVSQNGQRGGDGDNHLTAKEPIEKHIVNSSYHWREKSWPTTACCSMPGWPFLLYVLTSSLLRLNHLVSVADGWAGLVILAFSFLLSSPHFFLFFFLFVCLLRLLFLFLLFYQVLLFFFLSFITHLSF